MRKIGKILIYLYIFILVGVGCAKKEENSSSLLTNNKSNKFSPNILSDKFDGGYIDSIFISKNGERIYFTYSTYAPKVLNGSASPSSCSQATALSGHTTAPGVEWNTDLYYVEWDGSSWQGPVNLGSTINSLGMECCIWLNDDETEIIFYTDTDLDGDGNDGDLGLPPTGNYRATRSSITAQWSAPTALPGVYGTTGQSSSQYKHDIQKAPSGNLYLWEKDGSGNKRLLFGNWNGASYDAPVIITGSAHEDTQLWVSDDELKIVYNHRLSDGTTYLYKMVRANTSSDWGTPVAIGTNGFADANGNVIWGEPTFDSTEAFMIFIRFNTVDSACWSAEIMYSELGVNSEFSTPIVLN